MKIQAVFIIVCFAFCLGVFAEETKEVSAPTLTIEQETITFAECESGTQIPAEFIFTNTGGADLVIQEIRATCDCTEAKAEPKTVKPGESGKILVTLDTAYRTGDLDKEIILKTNDPAHPETTLHLVGKVYQPLTFKPSPLFFDALMPGAEAIQDATLMNTGKGPVTINKIQVTGWDISAEITGRGDAPVELPHTLQVDEYLWVRLKWKPSIQEKDSILRKVTVTAEPNPLVAVELKVLGTFSSQKGKVEEGKE